MIKINGKYSAQEIRLANKLLKVSCQKAIERSRSKDGTYKKVKCSFKSPIKFYWSIRDKKWLYEPWVKQTKEYMEKGKDLRYRPTLDRIDGKGHYYLYNIQVLSLGENSAKAHKK